MNSNGTVFLNVSFILSFHVYFNYHRLKENHWAASDSERKWKREHNFKSPAREKRDQDHGMHKFNKAKSR